MLVRNPISSLPSWRVTFYMPDGKIQRVRGSSTGAFIEIKPPEGMLVAVFEGLERGQKPHPSVRMLDGDVWKSFKPEELHAMLNPPKVEVVVKKAVKDEVKKVVKEETCGPKILLTDKVEVKVDTKVKAPKRGK